MIKDNDKVLAIALAEVLKPAVSLLSRALFDLDIQLTSCQNNPVQIDIRGGHVQGVGNTVSGNKFTMGI